MAESIPQLRRLLNDARERIRELENKQPATIEVIKEVPGPSRVEYRDRIVEVPIAMPTKTVTVTREVVKEVPGPVEVKTIFVEVEKVVEVIKEVPGPEVVKVVEVKSPVSISQQEKLIFAENPDHIETIKKLQEKICQLSSQLDLQRNQALDGQVSQSVQG